MSSTEYPDNLISRSMCTICTTLCTLWGLWFAGDPSPCYRASDLHVSGIAKSVNFIPIRSIPIAC
jgi:hypothetical protein